MSFFKRIFVSIILFFALHTLHSAAEVVNKVEVQGNERISKETVMVFGDIVIGKDYERSDISLLIKKLYDTNFLSNISVELKNNKLTITVKENPLVDRIISSSNKAQHS